MEWKDSLSAQYAIVAFDGLDCLHKTVAKNAAMRALVAADILEGYLREGSFDGLGFLEELPELLRKTHHFPSGRFRELEDGMAGRLKAEGILEEGPDLLGCDMNYYTAGVDMKVYRSDREAYLSVTEMVRAEILEEGPVTGESVSLLWLFRESGIMHEIFSSKEQEEVSRRMMEVGSTRESVRRLWQSEFHSAWELAVKRLLREKKNFFQNPYMQGMVINFPFLDKRQHIFVDVVLLGTNVKGRREAVKEFLAGRGHRVEEVENADEVLLRIDNACYRVWPKTIQVYGIPVQGVQLLPVYH